jgi:hypothetical protein
MEPMPMNLDLRLIHDIIITARVLSASQLEAFEIWEGKQIMFSNTSEVFGMACEHGVGSSFRGAKRLAIFWYTVMQNITERAEQKSNCSVICDNSNNFNFSINILLN